MPLVGSALALDVGTAKIGIAVSDAGRRMVFPLTTILRRSVAQDAAAIAEIARARGATALVVGLPDGGGRMARLARQVGDAVGEKLGLVPAYVDEGFTSSEARIRIDEAGLTRSTVDAHAAALIVEQWLASSADG